MSNTLEKLTIRGFKSIRELADFEFKKLNVFIGANGSGKSNIISFFRMLHLMTDHDESALDKFVRDSGGISSLLFNGRKATKCMEFETIFGIHGYRFQIEPGPTEKEWALTNQELYYKHSDTKWQRYDIGPPGTSQKPYYCLNRDYSEEVHDAIKSWQIYHFHDTGASAPMRHAEIVQDRKLLREDASNIAPFLLRIKAYEEEIYREIRQAVRLVMPYFDDFILDVEKLGRKEMTTLSWRARGSDYPLQPYQLSDGSIRFICLATALLQPKLPAMLIIDEPELGLHPAAISILAELIRSASKRTQLIIATQSPALIDNFAVEDIVVVNRKEGASTFARLTPDDYKTWLEDYSVGELWSKNVITGGPDHE